MNQFQDNLTWTRGDHSMKFGGGLNKIYDYRRNDISAPLTLLPTHCRLYRRQKPNGNRCSKTRLYNISRKFFGDAEIDYNSTFYNFFAQDDWKVTRKLKLNYGLRYDLYDIPEGDPNAPLDARRNFKVDKNNFAPRFGFVYSLRDGDRPTVIRGSARRLLRYGLPRNV